VTGKLNLPSFKCSGRTIHFLKAWKKTRRSKSSKSSRKRRSMQPCSKNRCRLKELSKRKVLFLGSKSSSSNSKEFSSKRHLNNTNHRPNNSNLTSISNPNNSSHPNIKPNYKQMSHISNKSTTNPLLITTSSSHRYLNRRSTAECLKNKSGLPLNKSKRQIKIRCITSKNTIWTLLKWLHKELRPATKGAEILLISQSPRLRWMKAKHKPNLNTKRSLNNKYKSRNNARSNKNVKEKLRNKWRSRKCWKKGRN